MKKSQLLLLILSQLVLATCERHELSSPEPDGEKSFAELRSLIASGHSRYLKISGVEQPLNRLSEFEKLASEKGYLKAGQTRTNSTQWSKQENRSVQSQLPEEPTISLNANLTYWDPPYACYGAVIWATASTDMPVDFLEVAYVASDLGTWEYSIFTYKIAYNATYVEIGGVYPSRTTTWKMQCIAMAIHKGEMYFSNELTFYTGPYPCYNF